MGYHGGCRKAKEIPMGYPAHSTKPKTTLYLNLRTLHESKTDFVSLPRTFHEAKNNFLSQSPDTPRNQKRISISIPRHYAKQKTNLDFDFRVLWKQKMNCDFAFRVSGKPKMNLDLRLRTLSEAKNESRFASSNTQ